MSTVKSPATLVSRFSGMSAYAIASFRSSNHVCFTPEEDAAKAAAEAKEAADKKQADTDARLKAAEEGTSKLLKVLDGLQAEVRLLRTPKKEEIKVDEKDDRPVKEQLAELKKQIAERDKLLSERDAKLAEEEAKTVKSRKKDALTKLAIANGIEGKMLDAFVKVNMVDVGDKLVIDEDGKVNYQANSVDDAKPLEAWATDELKAGNWDHYKVAKPTGGTGGAKGAPARGGKSNTISFKDLASGNYDPATLRTSKLI